MEGQGNQEHIIAQMHWELEAVRSQIDALTEQSRRPSEEIARLRNQNPNGSFGPQNGPRPFASNPGLGSFVQNPQQGPFVQNLQHGPFVQNPQQGPFVQNPQQGSFVHNPQYGPIPPQHLRTPPLHNGSQSYFVPLNGDANGSSYENGANLGTNPPAGVDPVAQRLKMLEDQNERVLSLLAKLPGAAVPVDVEPRSGFQASPFIDEIATVDVPKKFSIPTFTPKYYGITDPTEHIAQYKQLMWTVSIPFWYQEVCICKSFGATLTGAALQWLIVGSHFAWTRLSDLLVRVYV